MERKRTSGLFVALAVTAAVLLLMSAYASVYFAMVTPNIVVYEVMVDPDLPPEIHHTTSAFYPMEWMPWFFEPIHQIDRRLRPQTWRR